jgi:hypothetical protein
VSGEQIAEAPMHGSVVSPVMQARSSMSSTDLAATFAKQAGPGRMINRSGATSGLMSGFDRFEARPIECRP